MSYKPHISMVRSGSGAWGVYAPRPRERLIGKNNTFRTFREACSYARSICALRNGYMQQFEQQKANRFGKLR